MRLRHRCSYLFHWPNPRDNVAATFGSLYPRRSPYRRCRNGEAASVNKTTCLAGLARYTLLTFCLRYRPPALSRRIWAWRDAVAMFFCFLFFCCVVDAAKGPLSLSPGGHWCPLRSISIEYMFLDDRQIYSRTITEFIGYIPKELPNILDIFPNNYRIYWILPGIFPMNCRMFLWTVVEYVPEQLYIFPSNWSYIFLNICRIHSWRVVGYIPRGLWDIFLYSSRIDSSRIVGYIYSCTIVVNIV